MKNFLCMALIALCAFSLSAQKIQTPSGGGRGDVVTTDTIRIVRYSGAGGIYFEVRTQKFNSSQNEVTTKIPIGTTNNEALLFLVDLTNKEVDALAENMRLAILKTEVVNPILQRDKATTDTLGASLGLVRYLKDAHKNAVIGSGWNFTTAGGTTYSGVDIMDNTGTNYCRITINSVNYDLMVFSDNLVRIRNYPTTGQHTDLAWVKQNDFRELATAAGGARLYK